MKMFFTICLALVLFVGGFFAWRADAWLNAPGLPDRAATALSHSLGRKVTIGALQIHWQNPLVLTADNVHIANASWGSEPDMMRIGHMTAEVDTNALWHGRLQYRQLLVDDFDMLLERDKNGVGNWKFSDDAAPPHTATADGGFAIIPKNRMQFPTLIRMQLQRGTIRLRTSSGKLLTIAANHFTMGADGDDQPVHLSWQGAYNGIPAQLDADMQSYAVLRDGAAPYKTHVTITLSKSKLDYVGTMMNPLDADGLDGQLQITSSNLGELLSMIGMQQPSALPVAIAGPFTRQGDHWRWNSTTDRLADNNLQGDLALDEGARAHPDTINFDLASGKFNLKSVWDGIAAGPKMQAGGFHDMTNLFLNLHLRAEEFLYGKTHVFEPKAFLTIKPNEVALQPSTFLFLGGKATAQGSITALNQKLQFDAHANVENGNMSDLAASLGAPGAMAGQFNIAADLNMSGKILDQALQQNSRGGMVFSATRGQIQKDILEKTSMDLKTLFRRNDAVVPISCMGAVVNIRRGVGQIGPFRLTTAQGGLTGGGKINLVRQRLDMVVQSDAATSGFFALDIPLRISGPLQNIGVTPAPGALVPHMYNPQDLSPALRQLAAQNYCLKRQ